MNRVTINTELVANGPVYANGPVFIQGIDVKEKFEEIDQKLLKITEEDLKILKDNIDKLLKDFPVSNKTKTYLEKIREWIETGKNLKEIVDFIRVIWIEIGPLITNIIINKN